MSGSTSAAVGLAPRDLTSGGRHAADPGTEGAGEIGQQVSLRPRRLQLLDVMPERLEQRSRLARPALALGVKTDGLECRIQRQADAESPRRLEGRLGERQRDGGAQVASPSS